MRTYAAATCSVIAAWGLRTLLDPWLADEAPFILSVPAVVFAAWYGGLGPGLVALALGGALGAWVLVYHAPWQTDPVGNLLSLALYVIATLLIIVLAEAQRRAHRSAHEEAAARRASERRWAVTLRSIGEAVITTDLSGHIAFMNPVAESLTGWDADDATGRPCSDVFQLVDDATGAPVPCPLTRALDANAVVTSVGHTLVSRRAGHIAVDHTAAPIRDEAGHAIGGVLAFRDVTARREAELELRRQAQLLELAHDAVLIRDLQNRLVYMNRAAEGLYGWPRTEAAGKHPRDLLQTRFPVSFEAASAALQAYGGWQGELVRVTRDGQQITVEARWALQRDEAGDPVAILEIARDITERKRHEERVRQWGEELETRVGERTSELQEALIEKDDALYRERQALDDVREATLALYESEANYHLLFDACPQPVFVIDSQTLAFLAVNDAGVATFGYSKAEFAARTVRELRVDPADDSLFRHVSGLDREESFTVMSRYRRKDGAVLDVEVTGQGLRYAGRPAWLVVATDVTERRRAEQELLRSFEQVRRLAQHLQSVREEERTEVAREVHDELGQSLTGLKMDVAWVLARLRRPKGAASVDEAAERIEAMTGLIDNTISTVRRIATSLRPAVLDTLGLVAAIEWQTRDFEKRTHIRCEFHTNADEARLGRECSTAIFRIFQESLTNVARHAQAASVRVELVSEPCLLRLTVADDGVGISEERLATGGSLGLLGMRERALVFGGHVDVSGRPGLGTRVEVTIPCPCSHVECPAHRALPQCNEEETQ